MFGVQGLSAVKLRELGSFSTCRPFRTNHIESYFCCSNSNKTLRGMHMVTVRYPFHSHSLIDDNEMAQGASDKHWKDESDDNCS